MGGVIVSLITSAVTSAALSTAAKACNKTSGSRVTVPFCGFGRAEITRSSYSDCKQSNCRTSIANPKRSDNIFSG